MLPYTAPQQEMMMSLLQVAGGHALMDGETLSEDLVRSLLSEAAKLAEERIAPTLRASDQIPPKLKDGQVIVGPEAHANHRLTAENGWIALPFPEEVGGLNVPWSVAALMLELLDSSNVAFALSTCMTQGNAEAILAHGSQALIDRYVPGLLGGQYTGTMQLTESNAGSDVGALRTKAIPKEDGTWSLEGTKIYISWGDNDFTENVVHLVLARTPNSPGGTKGLSLFLVPKFLPDGTRNTVTPIGLEEKLGIHGSPTCTMVHEGSTGWLVGAEHAGMTAMFTMMNNARIGVGFQALGVSERALQAARAYAANRIQGGRAIIEYPDVRRMIGTMAALTCLSRDLGYSAHVAGDLGHKARADLLTPMAKVFMTESALEVTNLAIQVYGGMGVIEETGIAQLARDCRVFTIYEGTNGIQALDFIGRKTRRDQGAAATALLNEWEAELSKANGALAKPLENALGLCRQALAKVLEETDDFALAAMATAYLTLFCLTFGGFSMLRRTQISLEETPYRAQQQALASVYATHLLPRMHTTFTALMTGTSSLKNLYF